MTIKTIAAASCFTALIAVSPASADVIFNSITSPFTPFDDTQPGTFLFQGQSDVQTSSLGVQFSTTKATSINSIEALITQIQKNSPNPVIQIGIMADASGLPSGSFLNSTEVTLTTATDVNLASLNWSVAAGTYWLVAQSEPGLNSIWYSGSDNAVVAARGFGTNFRLADPDESNFEAEITAVAPVPEPSTWAMMI